MSKIIIVHGVFGGPAGNWFPWMKAALEAEGGVVCGPSFPTPKGQSYEAWHKVFEETLGDTPPEDTILIGHSIGATFVLRLMDEAQNPYRAAFLVCPFAQSLGFPEIDALNATFYTHDFDWEAIASGAARRLCFAGDNDPYVPLALPTAIAEKSATELRVIPNGGHLNAASNYLSFPALFEEVVPLMG